MQHQYKKLVIDYIPGDPTLPSTFEPLRKLKSNPNCTMVIASDDVESTEADAKVQADAFYVALVAQLR